MLKVYLLGLFVFFVAQCSNDNMTVPPSENPVDKNKAVVENISGNLMLGQMKTLSSSSQALAEASVKACSPEGYETAKLQEMWKASMKSFHYLEAIPAGSFVKDKVGSCANGGALACRIYSWPLATEGAVRFEMGEAHEAGTDYVLSSESEGQIGLDAMEYILFETLKSTPKVTNAETACPYLQLVTKDVAEAAAQLLKDYESTELQSLKKSQSEKVYLSVIDEVVRSFQFFEKTALYLKVNRIMGLPDSSNGERDIECGADDCYFYREHPWAQLADEALRWNIESFVQVYTGNSVNSEGVEIAGFGLQDYLIALDQEERSQEPLEIAQALFVALDYFSEPSDFEDTVEVEGTRPCNGQTLCEIQKNLKALADWTKSDLLVLLSKEATLGGVQGDND